jgi:hypothetical protein
MHKIIRLGCTAADVRLSLEISGAPRSIIYQAIVAALAVAVTITLI